MVEVLWLDRGCSDAEPQESLEWSNEVRVEICRHSFRYGDLRRVDATLIQDRVEDCTLVEWQNGEPFVVVEYKQRKAMEAPVFEWDRVSAIIRIRCERVSRDLARRHGGPTPRAPGDRPDPDANGRGSDEAELKAAIRTALLELPREQAYVATRCLVDGTSVATVAFELERSPKWVRHRKELAKSFLRFRLGMFE